LDHDDLYKLALLILCLILSAFFSAAETAYISLSKLHIRSMIDNGVKNAAHIKRFSDSPQKLLSAILIGNNLVNIAASALATSIAINIIGNNAFVLTLSTVIITFLILICSEITPKHIANRYPEKIAVLMIKPIYFFSRILSPIVFIFNQVSNLIFFIFCGTNQKEPPVITESHLKTIVDVSHEEGVLEIDEREMINNVVAFGDTVAKDIMIPRTDVLALDINFSYQDITNIFKTEGFSRVPVYHENIDNIIGILHLKDFIFDADKNNFDLKKLLREPFFTYEFKPTRDLFTIMRAKRLPMAIIVDEYGGTSGIITMEDLIEEIVGDISDEYDDIEEQIENIKENEYLVDGSTKLSELNQELNINLESNEFESIGGYLIGMLGTFPKAHEIIESDNLKFIIEKVDKNRVEKIRILVKKNNNKA